jgi:hydroxymethylpyrimidine pyrophosphatase-like HAD family hydrolase
MNDFDPELGWIGVDLDGTLALYKGGPLFPIGPPIPAMVEKVKRVLEQGIEVRVFTARVCDPDRRVQAKTVAAIEEWCVAHIGQKLRVTNAKDYSMVELWDDRAVQVRSNTGEFVGESEAL